MISMSCVELVFVFGFLNSDLLCEHELHTSLIGWLTGAPCPIRVLLHRYIHCYFSKAIIIEAEIPHTGRLQVRMCWSLAHWLGWHKRTSIEDVSKWWYFWLLRVMFLVIIVCNMFIFLLFYVWSQGYALNRRNWSSQKRIGSHPYQVLGIWFSKASCLGVQANIPYFHVFSV
jgi:hypothetical protein